MDLNIHNKYFRCIDYNQDKSVSWSSPSESRVYYDQVIKNNYERKIQETIRQCHHVSNMEDFFKRQGKYDDNNTVIHSKTH